jgi:hypothetical protein
MANLDAPFGLRPVRYLSGAPWNGAYNEYPIASGYATDLFFGDPVKAVAGGTIERAAAGDTILGVFIGCRYSPSAAEKAAGVVPQQRKYWPASTVAADAKAMVVDDPAVIYEVQADDDSADIAATDAGGNADLLIGTGSAVTGLSGVELDSSTITNASAQVRIVRLVPRDDNAWGDFAKVEVLINEHFYKATAGI